MTGEANDEGVMMAKIVAEMPDRRWREYRVCCVGVIIITTNRILDSGGDTGACSWVGLVVNGTWMGSCPPPSKRPAREWDFCVMVGIDTGTDLREY
jgi:hypothetical protein